MYQRKSLTFESKSLFTEFFIVPKYLWNRFLFYWMLCCINENMYHLKFRLNFFQERPKREFKDRFQYFSENEETKCFVEHWEICISLKKVPKYIFNFLYQDLVIYKKVVSKKCEKKNFEKVFENVVEMEFEKCTYSKHFQKSVRKHFQKSVRKHFQKSVRKHFQKSIREGNRNRKSIRNTSRKVFEKGFDEVFLKC
jgi:hypothetical protein